MGAPKVALIIPYVIFGLFFIIGLVNLVNPRFMWSITEGWKAVKEPPRAYFVIRRIIGLVVMLIPVVYFCVMFYLAHKA